MLILARRIGESIIINDDITLTVLGFNKNRQVKLGFEAPKEVAIHREEIFMKIKSQQEEGQAASPTDVSEDSLEAPPA